jgi:hypothetical protein
MTKEYSIPVGEYVFGKGRTKYGTDFATDKSDQIVVDIHTKKGLESYQIAQCFTGKVVLCFNQGGLAGCEKHETLKKVVKLK